jgi:hypothetical protein
LPTTGHDTAPRFERLVAVVCSGDVGVGYCIQGSRLARHGGIGIVSSTYVRPPARWLRFKLIDCLQCRVSMIHDFA